MYRYLLKPFLFLFPPEIAHHFIVFLLRWTPGLRLFMKLFLARKDMLLETRVAGLVFPNPVGLAAGFDKDARVVSGMAALGFGFIEIGTVTPRPQAGNPKPRIFRLPEDRVLINRMGFNNEGADVVAVRLVRKRGILIGGNIGKNKDTPNENAVDDYVTCFTTLYNHVDYFVVNVSSPNTPGLRALQAAEPLRNILVRLKESASHRQPARPLFVKISPDLSDEELDEVVKVIMDTKIDGVVATNTTVARHGLQGRVASEAGGLSGAPLRERATRMVALLREKLGTDFPIIAVGGIMSGEDAIEKFRAGANLVQVYTGLIYEGPGLVRKIIKMTAAYRAK